MSNISESNDSSFGDPPTTSEEGVEMMSFKFEPFRIPPSVQVGNCRLITDFKKISVIGEGAFSKVFKAKDSKTNELVALKKLRIEEKNLEGMPINYLREIMVLQDLDHENIVKLYEVVVGRSFESTYLVLEYCPFELSKVLDDDEAKRLIDHSHIKAIIQQLFVGLNYLHKKFVLHRDLAVTNILFSETGILKIADFGSCRRATSEEMTPTVGTIWYRAPELLFGSEYYTTAIDIWSAGCIFSELILKEPIFKADSDANLITKLIETLGTPNEKTWPGFSELPLIQSFTLCDQPYNRITLKFSDECTTCIALIYKIFTYNPCKRITAEECLSHPYFTEAPKACDLNTLVDLLKKPNEI